MKQAQTRTSDAVRQRTLEARRNFQSRRIRGAKVRQRILAYLQERLDAGILIAPSVREIMDGCGISSTSVTSYHLDVLHSEGLIERQPGIARGISLPGVRLEQGPREGDLLEGLESESDDLERIVGETTEALLYYYESLGERGKFLHWETRARATDELPRLAQAVVKDALHWLARLRA